MRGTIDRSPNATLLSRGAPSLEKTSADSSRRRRLASYADVKPLKKKWQAFARASPRSISPSFNASTSKSCEASGGLRRSCSLRRQVRRSLRCKKLETSACRSGWVSESKRGRTSLATYSASSGPRSSGKSQSPTESEPASRNARIFAAHSSGSPAIARSSSQRSGSSRASGPALASASCSCCWMP